MSQFRDADVRTGRRDRVTSTFQGRSVVSSCATVRTFIAALVLMLFSDLYYDRKLNYRLFSTKDASEHLESPQKWHYKYRF